MGSWGGLVSLGTITESSAGAGASTAWISLAPEETIHWFIERNDSTPTELYLMQIQSSPDGVKESDSPKWARRLAATDLKRDPVIKGPAFVRVFIQNADSSPADVVAADVSYNLNQVSL